MKTSKLMIPLALCAALCTPAFNAGAAKSFKRGVSENHLYLKEEIDVLMPGVSWTYNWANTPANSVADYMSAETMEFVPMCWNNRYDADAIREYCKAHPETKYLLGFNEPNFVRQANMSPEQAAEYWPDVKALADELGLELVGPAVNYSPDSGTHPDYEMYTWYRKFVDLVGLDAFDYIALHCYSGGTSGMKEMIDNFYESYGKKIWLTEFSMGGDGGIKNITPEGQISSMVQQLEFLEKDDRVFRYSWFIAKNSPTASPCIGLIVPQNGEGERQLSEQGMVYVYMTDFDETVYHGVDEIVPASEYINSKSLLLGSSHDSYNPGKLEITQFTSGAYADYQFDIPSAGEYTLTLRISGQGYDEGRFDPTVAIYSVDENGEELSTLSEARQLTLSGDETVFANVTFTLNLQAGRQRIRIADEGLPSGMHISCLTFGSAFTGVESITMPGASDGMTCTVVADGTLYLQGAENAATGYIYDLNGRMMSNSPVENNMMTIPNLDKGVYILKITTTDGKLKATKFIR